MFEMTQTELEITLQHYGWWGVADASEAEDDWLDEDYEISDKKWNIGYDAFISADDGQHSRFD